MCLSLCTDHVERKRKHSSMRKEREGGRMGREGASVQGEGQVLASFVLMFSCGLEPGCAHRSASSSLFGLVSVGSAPVAACLGLSLRFPCVSMNWPVNARNFRTWQMCLALARRLLLMSMSGPRSWCSWRLLGSYFRQKDSALVLHTVHTGLSASLNRYRYVLSAMCPMQSCMRREAFVCVILLVMCLNLFDGMDGSILESLRYCGSWQKLFW